MKSAAYLATLFVKPWEGFRAAPYYCPAGIPTIGYGRTMLNGVRVTLKTPPVTETLAEGQLFDDMVKLQKKVAGVLEVPLSPNQLAALLSFADNLGFDALKNSTLMAHLNAGKYFDAATEFGKWVNAYDPQRKRKVPLDGLVKRRRAEANLFCTPYRE